MYTKYTACSTESNPLHDEIGDLVVVYIIIYNTIIIYAI